MTFVLRVTAASPPTTSAVDTIASRIAIRSLRAKS
jgi:hypothetical protein